MILRPLLSLRWLSAVVLAALATTALPAQDINAVIAGMREDIRALDERTRSLTVEVEQLKRENASLRQAAGSGDVVTTAQLTQALADLEKTLRSADREVAAQVAGQMEKLARQTNTAIDALSKNNSAPRVSNPPAVIFGSDFPTKGVSYTVQPGDTLASIAAKLNARLTDIINANKIADPRSLQVGKVLFIPQR